MRAQQNRLLLLRDLFLLMGIALISSQTLGAENVSSKFLGLWIVQDSACSGCDPAKGAETGAVLRIDEQGIQDPFSSDCHGILQSKEISTESYITFQERLGVPDRWLIAQAKPEQNSVTNYHLYCGDKIVLKVIALPNGDLLLPTEASTVLRLRRH